eukprot:12062920-Alexandrium_andersonii.AAC.1
MVRGLPEFPELARGDQCGGARRRLGGRLALAEGAWRRAHELQVVALAALRPAGPVVPGL